jgi:hypothetical protein
VEARCGERQQERELIEILAKKEKANAEPKIQKLTAVFGRVTFTVTHS